MKSLKSILIALAAVLMLLTGCEKEDDAILRIDIGCSETPPCSYDFPPPEDEDYTPVPHTVTITNTGNRATGKLTIAMDGAAAADFEISATSVANIETGKTATFTVAPKAGLTLGDYRATVYVSGKGIAEQRLDVRFVVTSPGKNCTKIKLVSGPDKTIYGVKEPLDMTGIVVECEDDGKIIELKEEYFQYDFSAPNSEAKVTIAIGAAPVIEIPVEVLSIADRVERVAAGESAVLYVYADETVNKRIRKDEPNTVITITTPDNSTTVRKLKLETNGILLSVSSGSKIIIDGYVTLQGYATPDFGGTDNMNNTSSLVSVGTDGELVLKGHAKVTGNAYAVENPADTNILGGGITARGRLVIDEDAQISNNIICVTKSYPTPWNADSRNGKATWGGGVYLTGAGVMEIRGNAKITGNKSINMGGNAIGGAIFPEATTIYMYGGEISGNSTEASHRASSGGIQLTSGRLIMTGGVIKDNTLKFGGAGTGVACYVNSNRLILSGSASIPAKSGTRLSVLTDYTTITGITIYQDNGNTVYLDGNYPARVAGALTGTAPVATFDINKTTISVLGKYDLETGTISDFTTDAPVDKFALGSYLIKPSNYASLELEPVTDKVIKSDGTVGAP